MGRRVVGGRDKATCWGGICASAVGSGGLAASGEEENLGELDEERLEAVKAALEEEGIEAAPNSSLGKLQGEIDEEESQFPIRFLVGGRARANGCEVLGCLGGEVILLQQMATENLN